MVIVETIVFIFFFTSILMLIPAAIFTALENDETGSWDFHNSFYYTFITLSTVGFGDMVPGEINNTTPSTVVNHYFVLVCSLLTPFMDFLFCLSSMDQLASREFFLLSNRDNDLIPPKLFACPLFC